MGHYIYVGGVKSDIYSNKSKAVKFANRCHKAGFPTSLNKHHGVYIVRVSKTQRRKAR